ncbi:MAG: LysE family transporter [Deltaproteobacteria bacterium]|nr:LysE family transporter [Deltaproteobacteria bacterium]
MDSAALAFFLRGAALGISAAAAPGPLQTLLISETLLGGFRRGARVTLAPLVTDTPIIALVLLVLVRIPPATVQALSFAGGLYVLYLALGMWRQWRAGAVRDGERRQAESVGWEGLRRAVVLNWLNPSPYAFWILVSGPILVAALGRSMLHAAAFLIGFYGIFVASMLAIAWLFHQARRLGPRVVRGLVLASIAILVVFGVLLIGQGWGGGR